MTKTSDPPDRTIGQRVKSLYVELGILVFCGIILSGTGKTKGPVFDTVGPDFLPTVVALLVAGLVLLEIAMELTSRSGGDQPTSKPDPSALRNTLIFCVATTAYLLLLAYQLTPLFLATCGYMACTTPLLAHRLNWRDALLGAIVGLILGGVLQYVFTQIVVIDLPS